MHTSWVRSQVCEFYFLNIFKAIQRVTWQGVHRIPSRSGRPIPQCSRFMAIQWRSTMRLGQASTWDWTKSKGPELVGPRIPNCTPPLSANIRPITNFLYISFSYFLFLLIFFIHLIYKLINFSHKTNHKIKSFIKIRIRF